MRLKGLKKRNLGSWIEPCTENEESHQAGSHSHNLALHSLVSLVAVTFHFVPALIWIINHKQEQQ